MARAPTENDDQYSEKETAARRDATIKRMIAMPPKPHSEMKIGKPSKRERLSALALALAKLSDR
jgi:hypothetical protein